MPPTLEVEAPPKTFSETIEAHLTSLAATFDNCPIPVWFHDLTRRCLYRNPAAQYVLLASARVERHDVLDHADERLGQITLGTTRPSR